MAYNNIHLPKGYEVAMKEATDNDWVDLGVTYNEASLGVEYSQVKITGSQAEDVLNYVKDMIINGNFTLIQQDLRIVSRLLGGASAYTAQAGTLDAGAIQTVDSGDWGYNDPIRVENQNGDGSALTINSVTGGTDGLLVSGTDYYEGTDEFGRTVITIIDSATVTTEAQDMVIDYDYTPSASRTMTAGSSSVSITPYQLRFRKQLASGTYYTVYIYSAVNTNGFSITMPRHDADEPNILEFAIQGQVDTARTDLDQLFSIVDEYGIADNNDG